MAKQPPSRTSVSVRCFNLRDDLSSVLRIEEACFDRHAWPVEEFRHYSRTSPDLFLVAVAGGKIVGYSITCLRRDEAELASIAVLPNYRGQHVASALLRTTLRNLQRRSAKAIWLMVRPSNAAAVAFYRSFGFVNRTTIWGYYEDGSAAWRMRLRFE